MANPIELPHAHVYVRLGVSLIHGVGCFAIRHIPVDIDPFPDSSGEFCWVDRKDVENLPPYFRKLYHDFCCVEGGRYYAPKSFNRIDVAWYLNHSKNPNMVYRNFPNSKVFGFFTAREINAGEELTIDYDTYNSEPFKPDF